MTESSSVINFPKSPRGQEGVFLVASGKGGVGKTWFSITLGHALAQEGKSVLLFDGDLGLANIDIQLGLTPERDLGSVLNGQCSLADVVGRYEPGGFDIIAGRSGCGSLASLAPEKLTLLREELRALAKNYDCVLIDLGAGIGGTVRGLSSVAHTCLVIVTDEPTSLTDAYALVKVTHAALPHMPMKIVINQADTAVAGKRTYDVIKRVCANFLHYVPDLLGVIRRDTHVKDAIRNQTGLLTRHPNTEAAQDVHAIAKHLSGDLGGAQQSS